jgi:hypothetical protein
MLSQAQAPNSNDKTAEMSGRAGGDVRRCILVLHHCMVAFQVDDMATLGYMQLLCAGVKEFQTDGAVATCSVRHGIRTHNPHTP